MEIGDYAGRLQEERLKQVQVQIQKEEEEALEKARQGAVRRELVLCRVPQPVDAGIVGRLLQAIAMEFDDVTVRPDGDELVVVAPREAP